MPSEFLHFLLLEDSDVDAELITYQLGKIGDPVTVVRADIREDYVTRLQERAFDIILSDYSIPQFTGLDALSLARNIQPETPFIFISGVLGEERATEAMRAGATDYVTKRDLSRIPMVVDRALREARGRRIARESEAHYRFTVELNPQVAWTARPDGALDRVAERWTAWTGTSGLGGSWIEGLHPEDRIRSIEAWRKSVETGEPYDVEHRVVRCSGEVRWARSRAYPRRDDVGNIIKWYGTTEDNHERKLAEEELRRLNETLEQRIIDRTAELIRAQEALRQSQKLEAMGQLTGGVAHDFNNLLTPIIGSLDLLQRRGVGDERTRALIEGALQAAERAKTLVQRLLAFARRQPLQPTSVDLASLVKGMGDLVSSTSGPRIKVTAAASDNLPPAHADANQIEMAILNLAVNARDAMPEGGALDIFAEEERVGAGHHSKLPAGHYLRLSVADTGTGMDPETLARAIEPFFSTKGVGKGTGLGLSMVHGLAAQLGGGLKLQSRLGIGTRADLWLPVAKGPSQEAAKPVDGSIEDGRGTVLLVEDEPLVRISTAEMLTDLGYKVVAAESAEVALGLLDRGLRPTVVVTDHLMGGMTGAELAHSAAVRAVGMPVVLVSGYSEGPEAAAHLLRLNKPFRRAELAKVLAEAVQKRA